MNHDHNKPITTQRLAVWYKILRVSSKYFSIDLKFKMKLAFVIFSVVLSGAFSLPFHSVVDLDDHRWTLVRDGEGKMHLLDLNPIEVEPEPVFIPAEDMFFLLFTRSNPTTGQRITWTRESIEGSNFRFNGQTRFLIHGWTSSSNAGENPRTRDEFLQIGDHNVIGEC